MLCVVCVCAARYVFMCCHTQLSVRLHPSYDRGGYDDIIIVMTTGSYMHNNI